MSDNTIKKPCIDPMTVKPLIGASYPAVFAGVSAEREKRKIGDALGLNNFGVNLVHLKPGQGSAQRHWHSKQDEFVYILEGEATLISDAGEQVLGPGMAAGFPAGVMDGHHLVNKSDAAVVYLEVGDRTAGDSVEYPDIDLRAEPAPGNGHRFTHKDGVPYD